MNPNVVCPEIGDRSISSDKLAVMMLYAILLLFAWSFYQFTIFFIQTYSSARYHLSGQVIEASLMTK